MQYTFAILLLAATISLALVQPRIGRFHLHHGWAAWLGAGAAILTGLVPVDLATNSMINLLTPVATITGLMVITAVSDQAGLLEVQGRWLARLANGSPVRLFTLLFVTGAAMGSVFTNDAAVLLLTPLAVSLSDGVADETWSVESRLPLVFAVLHIGNLCGPLVISNPINIIVAKLFDISFTTYAEWMILPALASMVVTYIGLRWHFRRTFPASCKPALEPSGATVDPTLLRICGVVIVLTLIGFFSEDMTGVPTWPIAVGGALVLLVATATRGTSPIMVLRTRVGWDVLAFVTGIFLVVLGARNAGLAGHLSQVLEWAGAKEALTGIFPTAFIAGTLSSLMNNHPTADLMVWAVKDLALDPRTENIRVFAALIGGDLGPKMLPVGSLAALMWFRMLRERGIDVRYRDYIRIGVPVTLAAILVSCAVLALEVMLVDALLG